MDLSATPEPGWVFGGWTGPDGASVVNGKIVMSKNRSLIAVFNKLQYELTTTVSPYYAGSIEVSVLPSAASDLVDHGETARLLAQPKEGYYFDHWEGALTGSQNPADLLMDGPKQVTACFGRIQYHLTVSVEGQGAVTCQPCYNAGTFALLGIRPMDGWAFDRWSGSDAASVVTSVGWVGDGILMDSDKSLTAVFRQVPSAGNLVASIGTYDGTTDVKVQNNLAYVVGAEGPLVYNVSNPAAPVLAGSWDSIGGKDCIFIRDTLAYVTSYHRLYVLDIATSTNIKCVGYVDLPQSALSVWADDRTVLLVSPWLGLQVVDVSDPSHPYLRGSLPLESPSSVTATDGRAIVADGMLGLLIIDVTNPDNPMVIGQAHNPPVGGYYAIADGSYAFITGSDNWFYVCDISDLSRVDTVGAVRLPALANGICLNGNKAWVACSSYGIVAVDISNPAAPTVVGQVNTPGKARRIFISGPYAYVGNSDYGVDVVHLQL